MVPGGIFSDLMAASVINDIFFEDGDADYSWVGLTNWNYSTTFTSTNVICRFNIFLNTFFS